MTTQKLEKIRNDQESTYEREPRHWQMVLTAGTRKSSLSPSKSPIFDNV
ncbi:hypothetical protein MPER_00849, partial [Moniliophthora perniciosa FA553]